MQFQSLKEDKQVFQEVLFKVHVLFYVFVFKELTLAIWKEFKYLSAAQWPLCSTSGCYINLKIYRQWNSIIRTLYTHPEK